MSAGVVLFAATALSTVVLQRTLNSNSDTQLNSTVTNAACTICETTENDMLDSFKSYDRHILICTTSADWPSNVESMGDPLSLIKMIELQNEKNIKMKMTALHELSLSDVEKDGYNIIVYPDNIMFTLKCTEFEAFSKFVCKKELLTNLADLNQFNHCSPSWKRLVLVCVHAARDKRCGRAGPQIITELQSLLESENIAEADIAVRGSSHIGGHKYAGTLIVYPEGRWYGRVSRSSTKELLKNILSSTVMEKCNRGCNSSKILQW